MKLIYSQGFSRAEKLEWKPVVFSNVVQSFKTINDAMSELKIEFEKSENEVRMNLRSRPPHPWLCSPRDILRGIGTTLIRVYWELFAQHAAFEMSLLLTTLQKNMAHVLVEREIAAEDRLPLDYLDPVKALWVDKGVKMAIAKGNAYALHDNLA
jgi:guanine nucleotide-binding protein subunit alpha